MKFSVENTRTWGEPQLYVFTKDLKNGGEFMLNMMLDMAEIATSF